MRGLEQNFSQTRSLGTGFERESGALELYTMVSAMMKKGYVRKIVAVVIILNFVQLVYFIFHKSPDRIEQQRPPHTQQISSTVSKKWPHINSFTPWIADPVHNPYHSCEAFFGHGFASIHRLSPQFRCYHSDTLKTAICEGKKLVMHPERISMATGGEEIDKVLGRNEDDELPVYATGAFELQTKDNVGGKSVFEGSQLDAVIPRGQVHRHTMRALFESMRTVVSKNASCSEVITKPTLFVTRFEYANLFHTVTDWYSSYASSRVVALEERPMVVLIDGHCKSPMDDGWEAFFNGVKYAKHFEGSTCFDHAIFVPLGYETALFKSLGTGLPCTGSSPAKLDSSRTSRLREFGEVFSASFLAPNQTYERADAENIQILFIRREDYLAHPRHSGRPEIRLTNEAELYTVITDWAKNAKFKRKVRIFNGLFAHMKLAEQIKAVKSSSIILGVHGAGLTHIVFAKPDTVVLEILSPFFMRPHYQFISQWMGIEYRSIIMEDSTVDCNQVVQQLEQIISKFESQTH